MHSVHGVTTQTKFFLGKHHNGTTFGSLIRKGCELCGFGEFVGIRAVDGDELDRLTIAERDGSCFVEQQHIHIACRFHGATRHGDHVALDHPIHARNADGRKQPADGGGNEADEQRDEHGDGDGCALSAGFDAVN